MTQMKRISQETFDETVKENMDDFDMSREDAIADAIEQFKMQVAPPVLCPHGTPRANARNTVRIEYPLRLLLAGGCACPCAGTPPAPRHALLELRHPPVRPVCAG